jgi:RDD family
VLFEVLASGRTPGKRVTHLRVVRERGTPVDLPASAIRNLLRLIDILPTAYLVGLASILITERNQRLGDLAAGTLVIRDAGRRKDPAPAAAVAAPAQAELDSSGWDVSAVGIDELVAVRRFLERRESLDRSARQELAHRLEQGLRAKVAGAPSGLSAEGFLEELARVKASR